LKKRTPSSLGILLAASALAAGLGSCIITIDDGGASWSSYSAFHSSGHGPERVGSGVTGTDERLLADVRAVELEGSLDVEVSVVPGATQMVAVVGDDNLLPHVRTEVSGGVLHVDLDSGSYHMKQPLRVVAILPELRSVSLEGSGDIVAWGVDSSAFEVSLEGSGDVKIIGRTGDLTAGLSGSGDVDLAGLRAGEASVELLGSGDIRVFAAEALSVRLEGSGDVGYKGSPEVQVQVKGSGDVYVFD